MLLKVTHYREIEANKIMSTLQLGRLDKLEREWAEAPL